MRQSIMPLTEARKNIFKIAQRVGMGSEPYVFTQNGAPLVVLISADEFESWAETVQIASEYPNIVKDLQKAKQEAREGKTISLEDYLKKLAKEEKKYVPARDNQKRAKKSR